VKYARRISECNFHGLKIKSAPLNFLELTKDGFAVLTECRHTERKRVRRASYVNDEVRTDRKGNAEQHLT